MNKKIVWIIAVIVIVILIGAGIFFSGRFKTEDFGRKFNLMNDAYKIVLFATGQNDTSSQQFMDNYTAALTDFSDAYYTNPISPYSNDLDWTKTLDSIKSIVDKASVLISDNKLHEAHLELEKVRQEWQVAFERNHVTMLGFYLTEFHDLMESALSQADSKDYDALKVTCEKMKVSWQSVKDTTVDFTGDALADYNAKVTKEDLTLQSFCSAVDLKDDARLKTSASELKPGFIALYLKYG